MSVLVTSGDSGEVTVSDFFGSDQGYPVTLCGWIKSDTWNPSGLSRGYSMSVQNAGDTVWLRTNIIGNGSADRSIAMLGNGDNFSDGKGAEYDYGSLGPGLWIPYVAVWTSNTVRKIYTHDASGNNVSVLGPGDNRTLLGIRDLTLFREPAWPFDDILGAHFTVYQSALTQAQAEEFIDTADVAALTPYFKLDTTTDWGVGTLEDLSGNGNNITAGVNWVFSTDNPTITATSSVTQADDTPEDGVLQSFTTTGLTGTITAASLGGKSILSLLSNTDPTTATTYTLDISATESSIGQPRIGETSTLSVTATGGTATTDVVIQPKTGWTITTGASIDHTANGWAATVEADLSVTLVDGNLAYQSAARGEALTAAFVYTGGTTIAFQSTEFVIQQGGSATTTATSEGGAFFPFGEEETPNQFTFTDQTSLELSTVTESNAITVLGVTPATDFLTSITGGEYAVDSGSGFGAFTSSSSNVQLNYDVKVRNTTSGSFSTAVNTVLTIAATSDTFTTTTRAEVAPTLASTKALGGTVDVAFNQTLTTTGGDPATSWTITGGADQAQYSLTNAGVFTRDVPNPTEEAEVVTVTATNSAGTSGTQTVTITYSEAGEGNRTSMGISSLKIGI